FWGWGHVLVAALLAFVGGGLVSLVLLALRIKGRKDRIPFGPYLVIGAWLAIAVGDPLIDWWLG
ncbi:MAG: prepilin peptidase, partial [Acidimicrobiia bacterium]|nr:prepilin peptidase [Acidimicrobiia bacterium]